MKRILSITLLFLAGCSAYPYVHYDELDDAVAVAETPEEAEYYRGRIEYWESQAEPASEWLDAWGRCISSTECYTYCEYGGGSQPLGGSSPRKNGVGENVEKLVRWYRNTKPPTCGFVTKESF